MVNTNAMLYGMMTDQRVGQYHLESLLGAGGFGGVFLANEVVRDRVLKQVAVKVILGNDEQQLEELLAAATLDHDHLIRCYTAGECSLLNIDALYLVMELGEGSLETRLQQGPLKMAKVREVIRAVTAGLAYLHSQNQVHRDLKPANVLQVKGRWKLSDFGLVRHLGANSYAQTANPIGTITYMPPEAFEGKISPAWDMWSLGIMVVQMLSANLPYRFSEPTQLLKQVMNGDLQLPTLPDEFRLIVEGCLQINRGDRWDAEQVLEVLNPKTLMSTIQYSDSVIDVHQSNLKANLEDSVGKISPNCLQKFCQEVGEKMTTKCQLTSYITQQFAKSSVISLSPEFVGGNNAPATLKLSDVEFKEELILVKGKIYWQANTTDGEIQPYVKKRPVDPSWHWGKIHFAEWKNLDRFSPEVIEYFHRLRGLWDLHIKGGGKITPNIQPWWIPEKGITFKLSKEGEIWRASQINFGPGVWNSEKFPSEIMLVKHLLPTYISAQLNDDCVRLSPDFVGGDAAPATLKLSDVEFIGDLVRIKGKIYWQASTANGEIQAYITKRPVDPSWYWGKIHFHETQPAANFSPEILVYFKKLRALWDAHIVGGGKITPAIQPWWIPTKGVAFCLSKEGDIWRADALNLGDGYFSGRQNFFMIG